MDLAARNPEQTAAMAEALGRTVAAGDYVGLVGDLGAGKTFFVQGVARGLAVPSAIRVNSPTFTLLNEYRGGRLTLFHADLYRVEKESELREIGFEHALSAGGLVMVEWCDRFPVFAGDYLELALRVTGETSRSILARATGRRSAQLLDRWRAAIDASCA